MHARNHGARMQQKHAHVHTHSARRPAGPQAEASQPTICRLMRTVPRSEDLVINDMKSGKRSSSSVPRERSDTADRAPTAGGRSGPTATTSGTQNDDAAASARLEADAVVCGWVLAEYLECARCALCLFRARNRQAAACCRAAAGVGLRVRACCSVLQLGLPAAPWLTCVAACCSVLRFCLRACARVAACCSLAYARARARDLLACGVRACVPSGASIPWPS